MSAIGQQTYGIDHPLVTVKDHAQALEQFKALGFSPSPISYHPWGTVTSLLMFPGNFIEVIGVDDESKFGTNSVNGFCFGRQLGSFLQRGEEGISLVALHSKDADADHASLIERGLNSQGRIDFRRKMTLPDGSPDEAVVSLALFIDDDGSAYLYFHGKGFDYYVAEMADDMLSVKGDFIKMDMGGYEPKMEGPWVFKRDGLYYFTMPENNRVLTYYTATQPTGPWTYQGVFMEQEHASNNHHSVVEYKGQWLLFYHRWLKTDDAACDKKQRHVAAEYLHFNQDGTIRPVQRTEQGLADVPPMADSARSQN